jgi:hypothetical protein
MAKKKERHGNNAKIQQGKHVESLYQSNMAVTEGRIRPEDGAQRDEQVSYARKFVEENKK